MFNSDEPEKDKINDDISQEETIENDVDNETLSKEPQKIEVVTGDGNLNISPVYDHLDVEKPKENKKGEIIIPTEKKF